MSAERGLLTVVLPPQRGARAHLDGEPPPLHRRTGLLLGAGRAAVAGGGAAPAQGGGRAAESGGAPPRSARAEPQQPAAPAQHAGSGGALPPPLCVPGPARQRRAGSGVRAETRSRVSEGLCMSRATQPRQILSRTCLVSQLDLPPRRLDAREGAPSLSCRAPAGGSRAARRRHLTVQPPAQWPGSLASASPHAIGGLGQQLLGLAAAPSLWPPRAGALSQSSLAGGSGSTGGVGSLRRARVPAPWPPRRPGGWGRPARRA